MNEKERKKENKREKERKKDNFPGGTSLCVRERKRSEEKKHGRNILLFSRERIEKNPNDLNPRSFQPRRRSGRER